jgi:hypothetical protein
MIIANKDSCLATLNPKLAAEWHPTKKQIELVRKHSKGYGKK